MYHFFLVVVLPNFEFYFGCPFGHTWKITSLVDHMRKYGGEFLKIILVVIFGKNLGGIILGRNFKQNFWDYFGNDFRHNFRALFLVTILGIIWGDYFW